MARNRNSAVVTKRIAEKGTGTWGILQIMNQELRNNPGDVDSAAVVAKRKGQNLGLCYGPVWDEHGEEFCKMLYNHYIQPYEMTTREVPQGIRDKHPRPPHITVSGPTPGVSQEESVFTPPPFIEREPDVVMGTAAKKYYLAGEGKVSQQLEIGLWSHEDILAKIGYFEAIISGNTHSLESWVKLLEMVPPGGIVKDYVTNAQLEELNL